MRPLPCPPEKCPCAGWLWDTEAVSTQAQGGYVIMGLNLGVMGTESWTSAWWDGRGRSWALHTQRHCPKPSVGLRAEKASNAPLMALFSFAAFLALYRPTAWPNSKDSITERRIDWSLLFYLQSVRALDGQDELCRRGPFLAEEGGCRPPSALPPQDACCSRTDGSLETKSLQECPQAVGRHPEREGDS